jgi:hypothetical protein
MLKNRLKPTKTEAGGEKNPKNENYLRAGTRAISLP